MVAMESVDFYHALLAAAAAFGIGVGVSTFLSRVRDSGFREGEQNQKLHQLTATIAGHDNDMRKNEQEIHLLAYRLALSEEKMDEMARSLRSEIQGLKERR